VITYLSPTKEFASQVATIYHQICHEAKNKDSATLSSSFNGKPSRWAGEPSQTGVLEQQGILARARPETKY